MKNRLLIFKLILTCSLFSQSEVSYICDFNLNSSFGILQIESYGNNLYKNNTLTYGLELRQGINYQKNNVTLGIGIEHWSSGLLFPLTINYDKKYMIKNHNFIFTISAGNSFDKLTMVKNINDDLSGSFCFKIGQSLCLKKWENDHQLNFGVLFKFQSTQGEFNHTVNPDFPLTEQYRVNYKFITTAFSFQF